MMVGRPFILWSFCAFLCVFFVSAAAEETTLQIELGSLQKTVSDLTDAVEWLKSRVTVLETERGDISIPVQQQEEAGWRPRGRHALASSSEARIALPDDASISFGDETRLRHVSSNDTLHVNGIISAHGFFVNGQDVSSVFDDINALKIATSATPSISLSPSSSRSVSSSRTASRSSSSSPSSSRSSSSSSSSSRTSSRSPSSTNSITPSPSRTSSRTPTISPITQTFAKWNPAATWGGTPSFSNGDLSVSAGGAYMGTSATIPIPTSGKYAFKCQVTGAAGGSNVPSVGIGHNSVGGGIADAGCSADMNCWYTGVCVDQINYDENIQQSTSIVAGYSVVYDGPPGGASEFEFLVNRDAGTVIIKRNGALFGPTVTGLPNTYPMYPWVMMYATSFTCTFNYVASDPTYLPISTWT